MRILVPVDGSDQSERALGFAAEMANRFEADLHVIHFTDAETDATDEIRDRARETLAEHGVVADPEIAIDHDLEFRPSERVGEAIVAMVEGDSYDHVVMGHRGSGTMERAILGSAAETVVRAEVVPVTIVP